jgi:hypothetical protein
MIHGVVDGVITLGVWLRLSGTVKTWFALFAVLVQRRER